MTAGNFYFVMALCFCFWRSFFSFPPGILFLCISDNNNNCSSSRSSSQRKTGFLWFPIRSRSYWDAHSLAAPSTIVWCSCLHEQERERGRGSVPLLISGQSKRTMKTVQTESEQKQDNRKEKDKNQPKQKIPGLSWRDYIRKMFADVRVFAESC